MELINVTTLPNCSDLSWKRLKREIEIRQQTTRHQMDALAMISVLNQACIKTLTGDPAGTPSLPLNAIAFAAELESLQKDVRALINETLSCESPKSDSALLARALLETGRAFWLYQSCATFSAKKVWEWVTSLLKIEFEVATQLVAKPHCRTYETDSEDGDVEEEDDVGMAENDDEERENNDDERGNGDDERENGDGERENNGEAAEEDVLTLDYEEIQVQISNSPCPSDHPPTRPNTPTRYGPPKTICYRCWQNGHKFSECKAPKRVKSRNRRRGRRTP